VTGVLGNRTIGKLNSDIRSGSSTHFAQIKSVGGEPPDFETLCRLPGSCSETRQYHQGKPVRRKDDGSATTTSIPNEMTPIGQEGSLLHHEYESAADNGADHEPGGR
jgi:hypothetical protein